MLDLSRVVRNKDITQAFIVVRSSGEFGPGGWIENTPASINMSGVISVASEQDLNKVPEGDRVNGAIVIHTKEPLFLTRNSPKNPGTSDKIIWNGSTYRLFSLFPYMGYGFYKALAEKVEGA